MLREVGCVVFDEVHYMRDKSRGVVWEETIILLPEKCQYVFLSATIPNGPQFAAWVMSIHPGLTCHVVHTDKRPVPLRHYLFPQGGSGLTLIVDANKFVEENYTRAMSVFTQAEENTAGPDPTGESRGRRGRGPAENSRNMNVQVMQVMAHIIQNDMHPCIVFVFAKAECETLALALAKKTFNTEQEEAFVTETYTNAMDSLSEDDRRLPAVQHLLPLLQRGVGIHHSGLLPVLKEVVELLFQAGLVKCLFSTETFSMGLNMPARTVVFSSVRKFDGSEKRFLTSGEYIQMSGRAGRRGLDRNGVVVVLMDEPVEVGLFRSMVSGQADKLNSTFYLTYNMVLNLLRVEDADPTYMMMRSFYQFQQEGNRPVVEGKLEEAQRKMETLRIEQPAVCEQYWTAQKVLHKLREQKHEILIQPAHIIPYLQRGRVVEIVRRSVVPNTDYSFGIVVGCQLRTPTSDRSLPTSYSVEVLVDARSDQSGAFPEPASFPTGQESEPTEFMKVAFDLGDIAQVTKLRVKMPEDASFPLEERQKQHRNLKKVVARYKGELPILDPVGEMKISDRKMYTVCERISKLEAQLAKNPLAAGEGKISEALVTSYRAFELKKSIEMDIQQLQSDLNQLKHVVLTEELHKMMRVLRRLDYLDENNLLLRKGRIACEITTTDQDELLLTELLFRGIFNDMETEMIVALLSCLVNVHKTPDNFDPEEKFHQTLRQLYDVNARIHKVCQDAGLLSETSADGSPNTGAEKIKPSLIEVTYKWAKGCKFIDVVNSTDAYEGDIVRMMRRLEELLRQLASAARSPAVGSELIHDKMMLGIQMIKRDIVFASSLYL